MKMQHSKMCRIGGAAAMLGVSVALVAVVPIAAFVTSIKPYAVSIHDDYETFPLVSVGDRVPETSHPGKLYQMVGIPDGLGAHRNADGTITIYMNHELPGAASDTGGTLSEPVVGDPLNRGAIISKYIVSPNGQVMSGERAYDWMFINDTLVGPAPEVGNSTPPTARFCSASLGGPEHGFDRQIYFTNEEQAGAATFDGAGGLSFAIFDNEAHALPALGRFAWENSVAQPRPSDGRVVIMSMEDGPTSQNQAEGNSQLYMYVGHKDLSADASVLERNGLIGGTLYVFRPKNKSKNSELAFQNGSIAGEWVALPGAEAMTDLELEAASDAVNAMVFARPEDGAFNPRNTQEYFFVTTGGAAGANELGRLYSLRLNPADPTKDSVLTVVYNADAIVAAGGDIALSPDNIDASDEYLMICEDGTADTRPVMASKNRDGSIWRLPLRGSHEGANGVDLAGAERVVALDPPGRDGASVGAGIWETSGIIRTGHLFGEGSWLFDVQAHLPTAVPLTNTVEDGQLLLLLKRD